MLTLNKTKILSAVVPTVPVHSCNQCLNCRGDASSHRELAYPHRDLAPPPSRFRCPPSRFECWMIRRKRPTVILHLILAKKNFNFRRKPFFLLVLIQFRQRNYVIFTKVFSHAKCVKSRLQKFPLMQNFTI